ncbi:acyltransferase family protein [Myxococcus fulvus]|uniref:acyltransferase family protein n=1 Tax=Myxococcus fulvus TaxID=33 RepID=UPI003B9DC365
MTDSNDIQAREGFAPGVRFTYELGQEPVLDGVRGIACLMVMLAHLSARGAKLFPGVMPNGALGVDLFFVLSGFLITSLLLREWSRAGDISLKHFYARRALRLLPALYFFLAISVGLGAVLGWNEMFGGRPWLTLTATLLYVSNWVMDMGRLNHIWSLSVEEQFYLLWPPVLYLLLRRGVRPHLLLAGLGLLILVSAGVRFERWHTLLPHEGPLVAVLRCYLGTDTRMDAPLVGCAAALWVSWRGMPRRTVGWTVVASLIFVASIGVTCLGQDLYTTMTRPGPPPLRHELLFRGGFTVVALAAACLMLYLLADVKSLASRIVGSAPLTWVGRHSYSLYLWHYVAYYVVDVLLDPNADRLSPRWGGWLLLSAAKVGLATAMALLSHHLVERYFLRMKYRFAAPALEAPAPPELARKVA